MSLLWRTAIGAHNWPDIATGKELEHLVSGYVHEHDPRMQFRLHPSYPLHQVMGEDEAASGNELDEFDGQYPGDDTYARLHRAIVQNPSSVPPVVVLLHPKGPRLDDGNHRAAIALHEGLKTFPAYVGTPPIKSGN